MKKLVVLFFLLVLCLIAYLGYFYVPNQSVSISKITISQGNNALWAAHHWVGKKHAQADYAALAGQMHDNQITDVYFHVGPLNEAGLIPFKKYIYAKDLVRGMKSAGPGIRIQTWIGQREKKGGGPLDLSSAEVRRNIVATGEGFLDIGFDGIHYNIEPIFSGDSDFIQLLSATKALTSRRKAVLSIASQKPEYFSGMAWLCRLLHTSGSLWTEDYYSQVAEHVDQMAVMMYDTMLPFEWLYESVISRKTKQLVNLLGKNVTLYIGVPTYEKGGPNFDPELENIHSAIRYIQRGLKSVDGKVLSNFGLAIYARWTTSSEEWKIYRKNWLGRRG